MKNQGIEFQFRFKVWTSCSTSLFRMLRERQLYERLSGTWNVLGLDSRAAKSQKGDLVLDFLVSASPAGEIWDIGRPEHNRFPK